MMHTASLSPPSTLPRRVAPSRGRRLLAGSPRSWRTLVRMCVVLAWLPVSFASAQRLEDTPKELLDVGITEHLDTQVPLDLNFVDQNGKPVTLAQYFDGSVPVILTLNYSNCPMLCSMQLDGLFHGLSEMEWNLGDKFRMVTVSIDPKETSERAAMTRDKYLRAYGREGVGSGYVMLTGKNEQIKKLADTVGFGYRYVPATGEYSHAAVTMICTPDGRLSRYLAGVEYDPQTLRLSLLEASEGKIGSPMDHILLYCFQYDASSGKYGPAAFKLMRIAAAGMVLVVGGVLAVYWRRESKRKAQDTTGEAS